MNAIPQELYDAAQVRELDRIAIQDRGIDGYELMQRAGAAAYQVLRSRWPQSQQIAVLCGSGNNGGDGYVVGRLAHRDGLTVDVLAISPPKTPTARQAESDCRAAGVHVREVLGPWDRYHVIVDAMLGTGLEREVGGRYAELISECNRAAAGKLALDIPSGLHADSGRQMGTAFCADATVTFIGTKLGLLTGQGPAVTGALFFDDLDVPAEIFDRVQPVAKRINPTRDGIRLPARDRAAHKGSSGTVLVVGGDRGMIGAVRLAAEAAYRSGAGLVRVATREAHAAAVTAGCPELMAVGVESVRNLESYLTAADVIAVGPGLGQSDWAAAMLARVLESDKPLVLDADALNLLAHDPLQREDWVLTPHPGEAGRLLRLSTAEVQADRAAAAGRLQERFAGVVVLKGAGTLVCDGSLWLCDGGNPGMATGGMGDVLTGVVAALRAQGHSASAAARYGVWLHAAAGDRAAMAGEIGTMASDLFPHLRGLVNGID